MKFPQRGLYAITQTEHKSAPQILNEVEQILLGGAVVLQYRDKQPKKNAELAAQLLALCRQYQIPFLINDDIELAAQLAANGVHLGKHDGSIADARKRLGQDAIIGISCYNSIETALNAEQQGADYVAFGRFFSSTTKPLASPAHISTLQQAKQKLSIPIVAIGGILPDNAQTLLHAGADLLAVIGGLYSENPQQSARAYAALFNHVA